ncbi:MAG TPA: aromatic-ring-hydroxylating dioxygenase subunit beta [Burkholderiales bacterium]|nr:aromatic-ring-hydroxylating dioxygenase subunit beta [Burkholderiales bacterium]
MIAASLERWHEVQQFLFREARLLDERRFAQWLALFDPDAEYWVPYAWQQQSPKDHVSLYYETVKLLGMRVDRLARELSPLDTPPARVNHYLSNVTVEEGEGELVARAYLLFVEYRRAEQRWFAGRSTWRLRPAAGDFRIAAKRVDLLNADQESGHLRFAVPF